MENDSTVQKSSNAGGFLKNFARGTVYQGGKNGLTGLKYGAAIGVVAAVAGGALLAAAAGALASWLVIPGAIVGALAAGTTVGGFSASWGTALGAASGIIYGGAKQVKQAGKDDIAAAHSASQNVTRALEQEVQKSAALDQAHAKLTQQEKAAKFQIKDNGMTDGKPKDFHQNKIKANVGKTTELAVTEAGRG